MTTLLETLPPSVGAAPERLEDFCRRWQIVRLEFVEDASVEAGEKPLWLALFAESAHVTLVGLETIEEELTALLGQPVDLASRRGVEQSGGSPWREQVFAAARTVYAS